jgi:hypothetical protein
MYLMYRQYSRHVAHCQYRRPRVLGNPYLCPREARLRSSPLPQVFFLFTLFALFHQILTALLSHNCHFCEHRKHSINRRSKCPYVPQSAVVIEPH